MTTIDRILTHPGTAHKDEFLACSVLLATYPVPLFRCEPEAEDLANPAVCVVDVGRLHEPERNNFDHHQLPADHPPTCSLSLVLQHFGQYDNARQFCDWLETAEWIDCRGPVNTAKWLGVESDIISKLSSPIDQVVLRRFSRSQRLAPGNPIWEIMKMIGEDLLTQLKSARARIDFIRQHSEFWDLELGGSPGKILFLRRSDPLSDESSIGMERFIESRGMTEQVIGTVSPDRRSGSGYGLSRFRDNPRLDFTRIADFPEVHFAHAGGFVAKTSTNIVARLKELMVEAGRVQPAS